MMAASPRNRSVSLLSPRPEGCVHSSELLLGPDEGRSDSEMSQLTGLRQSAGSHSMESHKFESHRIFLRTHALQPQIQKAKQVREYLFHYYKAHKS